MIPQEKLGVVVLTNQESGDAFNAITLRAIDYFLRAPDIDYLARFSAMHDSSRAQAARQARSVSAARDSMSRPSLALAKYAGTYQDAWYGDVTIALEGDHLVMRFAHTPQLTGDMVHWQHDSFLVKWRDRELRADAYATFALNPDGSIDQVRMLPASPDVDFSFDFRDLLLKPAVRR